MGKYSYNFANTIYDVNIPPVALDFTSGDPELVVFNQPHKITRTIQSKITLGSFISMNQLDGIITNDVRDRNYYSVFESLIKQDEFQIALTDDFNLLRDFFQIDFFLEVETYCRTLLPKIKAKVESEKAVKLTPRKRRTYILAVIKSFARRNGRDFTKNLLEEINDRFAYTRRIKVIEVCNAEQEKLALHGFITKKDDSLILDRCSRCGNLNNHLEERSIVCGNVLLLNLDDPELEDEIIITRVIERDDFKELFIRFIHEEREKLQEEKKE